MKRNGYSTLGSPKISPRQRISNQIPSKLPKNFKSEKEKNLNKNILPANLTSPKPKASTQQKVNQFNFLFSNKNVPLQKKSTKTIKNGTHQTLTNKKSPLQLQKCKTGTNKLKEKQKKKQRKSTSVQEKGSQRRGRTANPEIERGERDSLKKIVNRRKNSYWQLIYQYQKKSNSIEKSRGKHNEPKQEKNIKKRQRHAKFQIRSQKYSKFIEQQKSEDQRSSQIETEKKQCRNKSHYERRVQRLKRDINQYRKINVMSEIALRNMEKLKSTQQQQFQRKRLQYLEQIKKLKSNGIQYKPHIGHVYTYPEYQTEGIIPESIIAQVQQQSKIMKPKSLSQKDLKNSGKELIQFYTSSRSVWMRKKQSQSSQLSILSNQYDH